jgi:hypothetical protein
MQTSSRVPFGPRTEGATENEQLLPNLVTRIVGKFDELIESLRSMANRVRQTDRKLLHWHKGAGKRAPYEIEDAYHFLRFAVLPVQDIIAGCQRFKASIGKLDHEAASTCTAFQKASEDPSTLGLQERDTCLLAIEDELNEIKAARDFYQSARGMVESLMPYFDFCVRKIEGFVEGGTEGRYASSGKGEVSASQRL